MRDIFACSKCHSIYEITRHRQQPLARPHCQVCNAQFPPCELGDWLSYQRAEPERDVAEWLSGRSSQFSLPSPYHVALAGLAQRKKQSADPALPRSRLEKLSSFSSAHASDERLAILPPGKPAL